MDPRTGWWILAAVVVAVVVWVAMRERRSATLRRRFGPEYERTVRERGSAARAEAELSERAHRVDKLAIRPLPVEHRQDYVERWRQQQARFVDEPREAIDQADHLVEDVMRERGYPVAEFDQRVADISVDHPRVVENYRAAHDIATRERRGQATTEDLRRAMVYYRDLFMELLEDPSPRGVPSR